MLTAAYTICFMVLGLNPVPRSRAHRKDESNTAAFVGTSIPWVTAER